MDPQPVQLSSDPPLTPSTRFRLTLLQLALGALALVGGAYSVGRVHAQLDAHELLGGHPVLVGRVSALELSHVKVATVLDLLEKRGRPAAVVAASPIP